MHKLKKVHLNFFIFLRFTFGILFVYIIPIIFVHLLILSCINVDNFDVTPRFTEGGAMSLHRIFNPQEACCNDAATMP